MKRERSKTHSAASEPRPARRIHEEHPDVYGQRGKLSEPTVCKECRALYAEGRWVWKPAPAHAAETICPACRRIADDYPAGSLSVTGSFATSHRNEIERMLRHVEEREKTDHPLHRIMKIAEADDGFRVDTTQANMVRSMGDALHHAYHGELEQPRSAADDQLVHVHWHRDA